MPAPNLFEEILGRLTQLLCSTPITSDLESRFEIFAEVGSDLILNLIGDGFLTLVRTARIEPAAVAADSGRLAAGRTVDLAPVVVFTQIRTTVPAVSNFFGFHQYPVIRLYSST